MAAIFTMVYARSKVFIPLIQARSQILRLAAYDDEAQWYAKSRQGNAFMRPFKN